MANIYLQSDFPKEVEPITVGELLMLLVGHDTNDVVVFQAPRYGAFGGETCYTITKANTVVLEERTESYPPEKYIDEDGDERVSEGYSQTWPAWKGVILS